MQLLILMKHPGAFGVLSNVSTLLADLGTPDAEVGKSSKELISVLLLFVEVEKSLKFIVAILEYKKPSSCHFHD